MPNGTKKDVNATQQAGFLDKRSFISKTGCEVLKGADWKKRKAELLERCGGRCEQIVSPAMEFYGPELRCRADADDAHHIIRRSVKRDDRLENLQALCRYHHDLLDSRKPRFGEKAAGRP